MIFLAVLKNKLSSRFIDEALSSGHFLEYDNNKNAYKPSILSERLFQLRDKIEHVQTMIKGSGQITNYLLAKYSSLADLEKDISIPNQDIIIPMSISNCQEDIVNLSIGIYKALEGNESFLDTIQLNPLSPLPLDTEKLKNELVTREEIIEWLSDIKYA
jgi:hypothetical protein